MPITVRDIAKQVKLSHTMVSRALNPNSKFPIAAEKRALIQKTARELGYQPNEAARILATGQSRVIALQIFDMENLHQQRVAQAMAKVLQQDDYDLIVHGYRNDAVRLRWSIDGVFILDRRDCPSIDVHSPNVSIGAFVSREIDSVYVDLRVGASEAMRHLILSGRRRIAHVDEDVLLLEDGRTAAYVEAMREAGFSLRQLQIERDSYEEVYAKV
jgi:LacI family transcriptional regulator